MRAKHKSSHHKQISALILLISLITVCSKRMAPKWRTPERTRASRGSVNTNRDQVFYLFGYLFIGRKEKEKRKKEEV